MQWWWWTWKWVKSLFQVFWDVKGHSIKWGSGQPLPPKFNAMPLEEMVIQFHQDWLWLPFYSVYFLKMKKKNSFTTVAATFKSKPPLSLNILISFYSFIQFGLPNIAMKYKIHSILDCTKHVNGNDYSIPFLLKAFLWTKWHLGIAMLSCMIKYKWSWTAMLLSYPVWFFVLKQSAVCRHPKLEL